jgi:hypothetical protein
VFACGLAVKHAHTHPSPCGAFAAGDIISGNMLEGRQRFVFEPIASPLATFARHNRAMFLLQCYLQDSFLAKQVACGSRLVVDSIECGIFSLVGRLKSLVSVQGLLAAFSKLVGSETGKQHTFLETDQVRCACTQAFERARLRKWEGWGWGSPGSD